VTPRGNQLEAFASRWHRLEFATVDADAETQWQEAIDRRSREIEEGKVICRPVEQVVPDIRQPG
jgi:hypothetical protein